MTLLDFFFLSFVCAYTSYIFSTLNTYPSSLFLLQHTFFLVKRNRIKVSGLYLERAFRTTLHSHPPDSETTRESDDVLYKMKKKLKLKLYMLEISLWNGCGCGWELEGALGSKMEVSSEVAA